MKRVVRMLCVLLTRRGTTVVVARADSARVTAAGERRSTADKLHRPVVAVAAACLLVTAVAVDVAVTVAQPSIASAAPLASSVTPFQPAVERKWGGRTHGIDVSPANPAVAISATESGGLFRTTDGGNNWTHLDGLVPFRTSDVKFAPGNASVVIATVYNASGRTTGGLGIFRSTDGGNTWSQPASAVPTCSAQPAAWGIAFEPSSNNVYVGTDCGVAVSSNLGLTWAHRTLARQVGVAAAQGGTVYTCGNDGVHRSTDSGATFPSTTTSPSGGCFTVTGVAVGTHTIAVSPLSSNVVFVSNGPNATFQSIDGGGTWTNLNPTTSAARSPFVAVNRSADGDPTHIDVYAGGGNSTQRKSCINTCSPGGFSNVTGSHADQSGVAFTTATSGPSQFCALYMTSDGGVGRTSDCGASFTQVGGGAGYDALQIYEVFGELHPDHTDLYFGTQDNDIWGSADDGVTWPSAQSICCEGFHFGVPRTSPTDAGQVVTGVACGPCGNFSTGAHIVGGGGVTDPANSSSAPFLIEQGVYVEATNPSAPSTQLVLSTDGGANWNAVAGAVISRTLLDSGHLIVTGPPSDPTIYVPVQKPGGNGLLKVQGIRTPTATVSNADVGLSNIDQSCNGLARFSCLTAVGIDPNNPLRLIVADSGTSQMKISNDGGQTWTVNQQLTNLVTAGGIAFAGAARAIAFSPFDANLILVGTDAGGIMASTDGGQTWDKLIGSEQVTAVTSFFYGTDEIIVSSYGRGLWKVSIPTTDLQIFKSHRPERPVAGQEMLYDLTVYNNGPNPASTVLVTDDLPPQVSYLSNTLIAPRSCTVSVVNNNPPPGTHDKLSCNLGAMDTGASVSFTVRVQVNADTDSAAGGPTAIYNTARVTAAGTTDSDPSNNVAQDAAIINESADLEPTKLCQPGTTVSANQPLSCTTFVDNHGPSDARGVMVDDTMVSQNGNFAVTTPAGCTKTAVTNGFRLTCSLGTIAAASTTEPGRKSFSYSISSTESQQINSTVVARSDTPDPDSTNNQVTTTLTIQAAADLAVTKSGPTTATAGGPIQWTASVTNVGPSTAQNIVIQDAVPAGVHITQVTSTGGSCTVGVPGDALQPTTCSFAAPLAGGGGPMTMTIDATVDPASTGILHNDARVSSDTFDQNNSNDFAHSDTALQTRANLTLTNTDSLDTVIAGTPLDYTLRITNSNGPSRARGITLTDSLPAELTFTSSEISSGGAGTCTPVVGSPNTINCNLNDLDPNQFVVVTLHTIVKSATAAGTTITNTATATSTTPSSGGGANSVTTPQTTLVNRLADLKTVKTSNADVYKPSATVIYTITVTNLGPSDAAPVTVVDTLPPPKLAPYVSDSGNGTCTFNAGTNKLTCDFGIMTAGTSKSVNVYIRVKGNKGTITNVATASTEASSEPANYNNNNTSTRTVLIKGSG